MRPWVVVLSVSPVLALASCGGKDVTVPEPQVSATITVTSPDFAEGAAIPRADTCTGAGTAPEVRWTGMPPAAKSAALVVTDPDAPSGTFVHWVLYGLAPTDGSVVGGATPRGAFTATNTAGSKGWTPPCPPSGTHHYQFTVYALSAPVTATGTQDVLDQVDRLAIARGRLTGTVASA
jgi:Raf kinase inhibitor-like YbhB/YbcL family protein